MIARIIGTLAHLSPTTPAHCTIQAGSLGYKVFIPAKTVEALSHSLEAEVALWTHHAVREDAEDLYGFENREMLEIFELLITVNGVGPKSALGILNVADVTTIREAVSTGDASYLTKASGIGKKSAEKIILELKDKMGSISSDGTTEPAGSRGSAGLVIDALIALGYAVQDAREAVAAIDRTKSTEDQVRQALRLLAR